MSNELELLAKGIGLKAEVDAQTIHRSRPGPVNKLMIGSRIILIGKGWDTKVDLPGLCVLDCTV